MTMVPTILYPASAVLCGSIAAWTDARERRIPNWLTGPAVLCGLGLHVTFDGWHGLWTALVGGLIAGAIFFVFYIAGGMGAGDVKLIAAVATLAGLPNVLFLLVYTSLIGGAMALALAFVRGRLRETLTNTASLMAHHHQHGLVPHDELNVRNASSLRLPYGVAIAAGCFITLYLAALPR